MVDWAIRPVGNMNDDAPKITEYVKFTYESEVEYRPALALERSKFFPNLLMTVHDFHFAIWKIDLEEYEKPIFRSVACNNTAHNTCGAFSPTRPGVIFITKTDGIDVWDFLDQSNKPSLTLSFATSVITYMRFQDVVHDDGRQYMAFGDEKDGTLFLWDVPRHLRERQDNEEENIEKFWKREVDKCLFVINQRAEKREEWNNAKQEADKRKQLEELEKEITSEMKEEKEIEQEEAYQNYLLIIKNKLKIISDEEFAEI